MNTIQDYYSGREHSFIKHKLIETYLERLFMILGQTEDDICYVDCFAGPWSSQDEDFKDTSIGIAFEIMKRCRESLLNTFNRNTNFRALFIERDKAAYQKLDCFCDDKSCRDVVLNCLRGEFYDLRNEILDWCGKSSFAFFLIDPTGFRNAIEIPTLEPLFIRPRSEFLINFMFSFIIRNIPQEQHYEVIESIFGEMPDLQGMNSNQKEKYLLHRYRQNAKEAIKSTGAQARSAYVKVLHPWQNKTIYDLVYLTRSPKGIKVFIEVSEKARFYTT